MRYKIAAGLHSVFYWTTIITAYVILTLMVGTLWLIGQNPSIQRADKLVFFCLAIGIPAHVALVYYLFAPAGVWVLAGLVGIALLCTTLYGWFNE